MSARDKDARAAMREIMRSWLAGEIDGPMEPGAVAHDAWGYADAMAAERAKRETAEAPQPAPFDIGDAVTCSCGATPFCHPGMVGVVIAIDAQNPHIINVRYHGNEPFHRTSTAVPYTGRAPDEWRAVQDDLASETAKLRAVAEAAARLQRLRNSNRPDGIGEASLQLDGALGNWLPGWRTK